MMCLFCRGHPPWGNHANASAGTSGGLLSDPVVATPQFDNVPIMDDGGGDAAAPPSASTRSGPSPPGVVPPSLPGAAADDTEPAAPASDHEGGQDDDDMELGDAPDPPPEPTGDTAPLASHDEPEDDLEDDERSSIEDSHGDAAMGQDGGRIAVTADQPEPGDESLHVSAGDERADEDMERDDGNAALATGQIATEGEPLPEGGAPLPAARSGSGLARAYAKSAIQSRLTTLGDSAAECALLDVYHAATSLLQPGGLMAGLLTTDMSVGLSVVVNQVAPALANANGLMSAVHAADADHLLVNFVKAAMRGVLGIHTAAGGASSSALSTQWRSRVWHMKGQSGAADRRA